MKFTLEINLGGKGIMSGEALAIALREQADYIATRYSLGQLSQAAPRNGKHIVLNPIGETIGHWEVSE